jgi:hypothetical protein
MENTFALSDVNDLGEATLGFMMRLQPKRPDLIFTTLCFMLVKATAMVYNENCALELQNAITRITSAATPKYPSA